MMTKGKNHGEKNLVIMTRTSNIYFIKKAKEVAVKFGINLSVIEPSQIDLPLEKFIERIKTLFLIQKKPFFGIVSPVRVTMI